MQREIKFRSWDGEYMIEWGFIDGIFRSPATSSGAKFDCPFTMPQMQYTGLKDKNGVPIYEGDIGDDLSDERYEVKFDEGAFVVIHDGNVIELLSEVVSSIEIIGNIYENSNLLK